MLKNPLFWMGIAYIALAVGAATFSVGQPIECTPREVYPIELPFTVAAIMAVPFFIGVLAGKTSQED